MNNGLRITHVVGLLAAVLVAGALIYASMTVNKVIAVFQGGGGLDIVTPTVPTLVASSPLAADPTQSAVSGAIMQTVQDQPIADEVRDLCWGLAIAIDRSRTKDLTPQQVIESFKVAGQIQFGGRTDFPPAVGQVVDAQLLVAMGTDPTGFDDVRRNSAISTLRALAWGAEQAYEGN